MNFHPTSGGSAGGAPVHDHGSPRAPAGGRSWRAVSATRSRRVMAPLARGSREPKRARTSPTARRATLAQRRETAPARCAPPAQQVLLQHDAARSSFEPDSSARIARPFSSLIALRHALIWCGCADPHSESIEIGRWARPPPNARLSQKKLAAPLRRLASARQPPPAGAATRGRATRGRRRMLAVPPSADGSASPRPPLPSTTFHARAADRRRLPSNTTSSTSGRGRCGGRSGPRQDGGAAAPPGSAAVSSTARTSAGTHVAADAPARRSGERRPACRARRSAAVELATRHSRFGPRR